MCWSFTKKIYIYCWTCLKEKPQQLLTKHCQHKQKSSSALTAVGNINANKQIFSLSLTVYHDYGSKLHALLWKYISHVKKSLIMLDLLPLRVPSLNHKDIALLDM